MPEELVFTRKELEHFHALMDIYRNDPSASSQTASNLHGLTPQTGALGLFGAPGVEPMMYSTIVRANGSFSRALALTKSEFLQVRRDIVTGVTDQSGTNPSNFCGDAITHGDLKVCRHDFEFGEVKAATKVVEGPKVGAYYTRYDMDRQMVPDGMDFGPWAPDILSQARNRNSITWKVLFELSVNVDRQHEIALIQGNSSASNVGAGSLPYFIVQPDGLDQLIKTGYVDVKSQVACPAVDSRVVTFSGNLTGTDANGDTLLDVITDAMSGNDMDLQGMGYVEALRSGAFVMHPRMWRPITRVWPCSYQTMGCDTLTNGNGERLNISADRQRQMQEEMYLGKYLLIDGVRVPVLFSWSVPITNVGPDQYNGPLYFVPMVLNGNPVTYIDHFDMGNDKQNEFYNLTGQNDDTRVINNGLYRMERRMKGCLEYDFSSMWRLMFEAPFAAIRWDDITFFDRTRQQSPYSGESYYANGGQTSQNAPV